MAARVTKASLDVTLADGRRIVVPLSFYPTLLKAPPRLRNDWHYLARATGLRWEALDLDLSVMSIVDGSRERVLPTAFYERLDAQLAARGLSRRPQQHRRRAA